ANKVNPYYFNIDYKIEVKKDEYSKEILFLYKLFYNILKNEFLLLKKMFRDLLYKGFIYINNSSAIVLILFIRKLSRGLQFYYNYLTLNTIMKINYYSLPLIKKTFYIITKAK
ncbi:hypothetical protein B0T13DRAFT_400551, partial [Neurospora crassa]